MPINIRNYKNNQSPTIKETSDDGSIKKAITRLEPEVGSQTRDQTTQTQTTKVQTAVNSPCVDQLTLTQLTVDQATKVEAAIMAIQCLFFLSIIQTAILVFTVFRHHGQQVLCAPGSLTLPLEGGVGKEGGALNTAPGPSQTLALVLSSGSQVLSPGQSHGPCEAQCPII